MSNVMCLLFILVGAIAVAWMLSRERIEGCRTDTTCSKTP